MFGYVSECLYVAGMIGFTVCLLGVPVAYFIQWVAVNELTYRSKENKVRQFRHSQFTTDSHSKGTPTTQIPCSHDDVTGKAAEYMYSNRKPEPANSSAYRPSAFIEFIIIISSRHK